MQTRIAPELADDPRVAIAEAELRRCVHCGFCLATCPTYRLLGDELDSPRGRIYLIKQVVEGETPTRETQLHLDRCLTCRNCETTCPSGVRYGHLVDQGRSLVAERVERPLGQRLLRAALLATLPYPARFGPMVRLGQLARPLMPRALKAKLPPRARAGARPAPRHARRVLALEGCAQPSMTPATNAALARVLDRLGVSLVAARAAGCCGAVAFHLDAQARAREQMRANIDAWWPEIESGAEAIVVSASGCGVMVKEYAQVLADDPAYAEKAARVAALARDTVELLEGEDLPDVGEAARESGPIAFHPPCTLQHGQRLAGRTEALLRRLGLELVAVADSHLCCGSAGTYSILQPALATELRDRKVAALEANAPAVIATANIGCQLHIGGAASRPTVHWIELLDRLLERSRSSVQSEQEPVAERTDERAAEHDDV